MSIVERLQRSLETEKHQVKNLEQVQKFAKEMENAGVVRKNEYSLVTNMNGTSAAKFMFQT